MKKTISVILAVLFICAVTTVSSSGAKKTTTTKTPASKNAKQAKSAEKLDTKTTLTGKVISVNTVARTITISEKVKGKEEKTLVILDEKTGIAMSGEKRTLADIKKGDEVRVQYTEVEGKMVAKDVAIMPVKAPRKK